MRLMLAKYLSEYQPRRMRSTSSLKTSFVSREPSKIDIGDPMTGSADRRHDLDAVEMHAVQEDALQQSGIVRYGADSGGAFDRQIVGVDTVLPHQDAALELPSVGIQPQVHRQLVGAQVGAVADDDVA